MGKEIFNMNDIDKVKQAIKELSYEASNALEELMVVHKSGTINSPPNRDDLLILIHACQNIISCNRFFGMIESERIIEATGDPPLPIAVKKYLGIDRYTE